MLFIVVAMVAAIVAVFKAMDEAYGEEVMGVEYYGAKRYF